MVYPNDPEARPGEHKWTSEQPEGFRKDGDDSARDASSGALLAIIGQTRQFQYPVEQTWSVNKPCLHRSISAVTRSSLVDVNRHKPIKNSAIRTFTNTDPKLIRERRLRPEDWPDAIAETEGPQLVIAGPGAGKTEFLVRRIARLTSRRRLPGSSILALTFSRRASSGLNTRIRQATRDPLGEVGAGTFHSFAQRMLEAHAAETIGWKELPSILTGPEQVGLVSELLRTDPPGNWPLPFRKLLPTRTLASEVTDFILRSREMMLDSEELERRCAERDDWRALPMFISRYNQVLEQRQRIDYGDLINRAREVIGDPKVLESVREQYRYVLVDEYQDTSPAQAGLLQAVCGIAGNVTAAADSQQSIYGFRGAAPTNVSDFFDMFSGRTHLKGRKWILSTSFRTPRQILEAAQRLTTGIRMPGAVGPVEPAPHAGRVEIRIFDQESEESEWIAAEAARLHLEQDVPFSKMAVLVRTKRRLLIEVSRALDRRSIPHDRPDARLADHPANLMIFDVARAAVSPDRRTATPFVRRLLLGPLFNLDVTGLRRLERGMSSGKADWPEMIRRLPDGEALAALLEDPSWTELPAIDGFWKVWTGLPQLRDLATAPERAGFRAAWTSLAQVLVRAGERNPSTSILEYMSLVESDDFEASPLLSYSDPSEDRMVLTTLHQVKGLEFQVVFIADAVDGVLPDLRRSESLLQTERLDPIRTGSGRAVYRRLHEEARLLYTAMTRASSRVFISATSAGPDEEQRRPSRFLDVIAGDEVVVVTGDPRQRKPLTMKEAESWLRRILVDPSRPSYRRLGAAHTLACGEHLGLRPPIRYAAIPKSGSGEEDLVAGRRLSLSDAARYKACPRQFALERLLKVTVSDNPYITFGNLIHRVLESTERQAAGEGRKPDLDEALARLYESADGYDLGPGSIGKAWRRRGTLLLTRLYADFPKDHGPVVLLEHPVSIELGGFLWQGRIDRVERSADGNLRIVDYKTGKNPPSIRESSGDLQLGSYLLAAAGDPGVNRFGPVRGAEFWHPLAGALRRRVTRFDPSRLEEVRSRLLKIADRINKRDWSPTPGTACRTCNVRSACPAWPEGQDAYRR